MSARGRTSAPSSGFPSTPFGVSTGRVFSPTVPSARHHHEPVRPYQDDQEHDQHHGELQVLVLRRRGLRSEQGQEDAAQRQDQRYRARYQHRLRHGAMNLLAEPPSSGCSSLTVASTMPLRRATGELLRTQSRRSSQNSTSET